MIYTCVACDVERENAYGIYEHLIEVENLDARLAKSIIFTVERRAKHLGIIDKFSDLSKPEFPPNIINRDKVNHPSHYTFSKYEVLDILLEWFPDNPLLWQVNKYIARAKHKGNYIEDLEKARFYLDKAIGLAREKENNK